MARLGWSAVLALLCATVTCLPLFLGQGQYVGNGTDLPWQHIPLRQWMGETARSGEFPLWNPYLFNGYPGWVFRPPWSISQALWYLSSEARWILPLHILLHMAWLHLGVQSWLLDRGRSRAAALLGAQTLLLSGFVLGHLYAGHIDILEALAWAPWVLWTYERYHERRSAARLLAAATTIFFMLNTGHFHIAYLVLWTAVVWNAARQLAGEWDVPGGITAYSVQTVHVALASAGLSCFYLAPMLRTLGWFNRTSAAGGFDLNLQPLSSWWTWLVPDLMNLHSTPLNWSFYPLWECHAYMGLFVPVLLLGAGLPPRRRGSLLFVVFAALLALGPRSPVYSLYSCADPLLGLFRVPSRFLLPALLALTVLVAEMWDATVLRKRALWLIGICWVGALLLSSWGFWTSLVDVLSAGRALPVFEAQRFPDSLAAMRGVTALRLVAQGLLFAVTIRLCSRRGVLSSRNALLGLLLLTLLDGARVVYPYWTRRAAATSPTLPAEWLATLREHPEYRSVIDPGVIGGDWAPPHRVAQLDGGEISALGAYTVAVQAAAGMDEKGGVLFNLFGVNRLTEQLSLRYYFSQRPPGQLTPDLRGLQPVQSLAGWWMYVNPAALPRVQTVHRLVPETAPRAYDNLRYLLALPEYPRGVASWRGEPWNSAPAGWELQKARYGANRVQLEVTMDGPAVLLLADAYVPGWTVEVDGRPQPLLSLNAGLCRGVRLEAGTHWVEFSYGIPGLGWAALVSVATLIVLLAASSRTLRATPV